LDESEILGNICILLIAGHETSASVLETALILLATEPEFQQSIQEEIDSIWAAKEPGEDLTYDDYPKMRTIMALMVCTLSLLKNTSPVILSVSNYNHLLLANPSELRFPAPFCCTTPNEPRHMEQ
jgi:Cytochrome P450